MAQNITPIEAAEIEAYYVTGNSTLAETAEHFGRSVIIVNKLSRDNKWKIKRKEFAEKKNKIYLRKEARRLAELDAKAMAELGELADVSYAAGKVGKFDNSSQAVASYIGLTKMQREILAGAEQKTAPRLMVKLPDGTEITAIGDGSPPDMDGDAPAIDSSSAASE